MHTLHVFAAITKKIAVSTYGLSASTSLRASDVSDYAVSWLVLVCDTVLVVVNITA